MKRFLLITSILAACFVALSFVYDYAVLWMMRRSPSCAATKIERAVTGGAGESIAIFGSSRALGNYMPSLLAQNAFNYGVNGMALTEVLLLVNQYLQHNTSDSLVIINLDPWAPAALGKNELIGDYRLAGKNQKFRESMPNLDLSWPDWTPGLRFQGELKTALTSYINAQRSITKKIDNGAEILLNSRTESEWTTIKKELTPYSFHYNSQWETLLKEIYKYQGAHRLIWVVTPTCPAHHNLHQNPLALTKFLQDQDSKKHVTFLNFFDETADYPDALFTDPTHFNVRGAEKFTKTLKMSLDSLSDF